MHCLHTYLRNGTSDGFILMGILLSRKRTVLVLPNHTVSNFRLYRFPLEKRLCKRVNVSSKTLKSSRLGTFKLNFLSYVSLLPSLFFKLLFDDCYMSALLLINDINNIGSSSYVWPLWSFLETITQGLWLCALINLRMKCFKPSSRLRSKILNNVIKLWKNIFFTNAYIIVKIFWTPPLKTFT